jgi:hypothetical protein
MRCTMLTSTSSHYFNKLAIFVYMTLERRTTLFVDCVYCVYYVFVCVLYANFLLMYVLPINHPNFVMAISMYCKRFMLINLTLNLI